MRIQNIDARVSFFRVQLFIKVCVLALALPLITVITCFHTRVSHEGLCIPLSGISVNILFIYSEQLGVFLSNFETLIKFSSISIISAYVQIAFTCQYTLFAGFLS